MITLAMVCTGTKYSRDYVERLAASVRKHLAIDRIIVLVDRPLGIAGVTEINIAWSGLTGWWAKMLLLDPAIRGPGRCLFLDLDMVVLGDLKPLAEIESPFAICANFTRAAGNLAWPCRYGSCAMVFQEGWGGWAWRMFWKLRAELILSCPKGDQQAIERLIPNAPLLQDMLPPGFFLHYRGLDDVRQASPQNAKVVVFGGSHKPHNCTVDWVRKAWREAA
jgi:hypothetical protein